MNWSRIILVLLYSAGMYQCYAQSTIHRIIVADNNTLQVLVNASVSDKSHYYNTTTDTHGAFNCPFFSDSAQITIKHIGYETKTLKLTVASDTIFLRKRSIMLNVVDVIGNEYYNLHSATNINSTTIDHIQSASLKDVFNLLPGNLSLNPDLSQRAQPMVRDIDVNIGSSRGTAVIIDGNRLSANADILSSPQVFYTNNLSQFQGFDFRTIPTDNIETVEIVRGVPSAQHGDLTSTLINITTQTFIPDTKIGIYHNPKFKSINVQKGLQITPNHNIGTSISYTSSTPESRNPLTSYKRLAINTGSRLRFSNQNLLSFNIFGYHTIDQEKKDLDLISENEQFIDSNSALNSFIKYDFGKKNKGIISFAANVKRQYNKIRSYSSVQELNIYSKTTTPGENRGFIAPSEYLQSYSIEGIPIDLHLKFSYNFKLHLHGINNNTLLGLESKYEKNLGRGVSLKSEITTINTDISIRNWPFNKIPGYQSGALYMEENLNKTIHHQRIEAQIGARYSYYYYSSYLHTNLEPRINLKYTFLRPKNIEFSILGAFGTHYKVPDIDQLYPNDAWIDLLSVNYYDTKEPSNSYIIFNSQNISTQNPKLKPSKSRKYEFGVQLKHSSMNMLIMLFREYHTQNIFYEAHYKNINYNTYEYEDIVDYSRLPYEQMTPYKTRSFYARYYSPGNILSTKKEGIEFTLNTRKIKPISTTINLSGAWLNILNDDQTTPYQYLPPSTNSEQLDYIAVYPGTYAKKSERLSTKLRFVTHIPKIGMVFSTTIQTIWLYKYNFIKPFKLPISLINREGNTIPFTAEMAEDPAFYAYLYTTTSKFDSEESYPITTQINFNLSKEFAKRFKIVFMANNITNYRPLTKLKSSDRYVILNQPLYYGLTLSCTLQ